MPGGTAQRDADWGRAGVNVAEEGYHRYQRLQPQATTWRRYLGTWLPRSSLT